MTITEKIADRKAKIDKAQSRIADEQSKIAKWRKELETLESLEIKALLKEIDMPMDQVKELLQSMNKTVVPGNPAE